MINANPAVSFFCDESTNVASSKQIVHILADGKSHTSFLDLSDGTADT